MVVNLGDMKSDQGSGDNREPIKVDAAFMVVIRDGHVQASPDINAPIVPEGEVTIDQMQMAARKVYDDIQATKTAGIVQAQMHQTAQQMMSRAEDQKLMQNLNL